MKSWIRQYGGSLLIVILAFAYLTRIYNIHLPEEYMFDEVYHAVTAKLIAENDQRAYEWWNPPPEVDTAVDWLHPPLAKYFQALSILAFGENSFGWRFSSVVFGILVLVAVYHLALHLFNDEAHAIAATALASLDGLLLVQSRIAMNDIFVTFFILLTLLVYSRYRQDNRVTQLLTVGLSAGLSLASKWSGLFILITIMLLECLRLLELGLKTKWAFFKPTNLGKTSKTAFTYVIALLVLPAVIYVLSYSQMFLQGKNLAHFKELHNQIWHYQTHLEATHPYQSRPWQWALNLRPVWYYVEYQDQKRADVYAFGNPALFWLGLLAIGYTIIVIAAQAITATLTKKKFLSKLLQLLRAVNSSALFLLVIAYLMVWLPWQLSPRIMFFYHYTPAVPLLAIILAYWLVEMYKQKNYFKYASFLCWAALIGCFMIWYPHWVGSPIATSFKDSVYFALPGWK